MRGSFKNAPPELTAVGARVSVAPGHAYHATFGHKYGSDFLNTGQIFCCLLQRAAYSNGLFTKTVACKN
jgi:hypothetical protein